VNIALVIPMNSAEKEKGFYDYNFYSTFFFSRKYISYLLAIPTLISLTPPEHEIRVFDENIEDIDYTWEADLVGITVRTMFAQRAYSISETFRKRGVKTVLGGIHPSMCPEESLQHCDSVVIGEAENTWAQLLKDAQKGRLKRLYKSDELADLKTAPVPVRTFLKKDKYLSDIVQTAKGCPFHCEFCSVHAFDGQKIRTRTVEQIIREIKEIQGSAVKYKTKSSIFFADDNIIANKKLSRELFLALKPYDINWMCQASVNISRETELLELMRESGCGAIFIGFESLSQEALSGMHKEINQRYDYLEAIRTIQSHGILVHSSFILGSDSDSAASFDELIDFIQESHLLMPLINILTPLPGTRLFKRLEEEGRLFHKDWRKYDTKCVVFSPSRMSPEELLQGYRKVVREVYSFESILKKLNHYWDIDFWKHSNEFDPVKFKYRLIFALRLFTLLFSGNMNRSRFIAKILPRVFERRVRISTILALLAYNDFAESL
jgi:radical SAM superfamily enzyme YgiQ (UPF0313 family)